MIKNFDPNPLAIFGLRKMTHCPPHFQKVTFKQHVSDRIITDWIFENTNSRFYFSSVQFGDSIVAFESHAEASYFVLMIDQINKQPSTTW